MQTIGWGQMKKKEIDTLLKKESGKILLKKKSAYNFWEEIFGEVYDSLVIFFYFLTRRKFDYLIVTEYRIVLIIRNKLFFERVFNRIENLTYNGIKSTLEVSDQNENFLVSLKKFRINYEESKFIKERLSEFRDSRNKIHLPNNRR